MHNKVHGVNYIYSPNLNGLTRKLNGINPNLFIGELFNEEHTFFESASLIRCLNHDCSSILLDDQFKTEYTAQLFPEMGILDCIIPQNLNGLYIRILQEKAHALSTNFRNESIQSKKNERIVSCSESGLVITDHKGKVEWINGGLVNICGHEKAIMVGEKPGDVLQGSATNLNTVRFIREKLQTNNPFQCSLINYHADDHPYWVQLNVIPIYRKNERNKFLGVEKDVSHLMPALI